MWTLAICHERGRERCLLQGDLSCPYFGGRGHGHGVKVLSQAVEGRDYAVMRSLLILVCAVIHSIGKIQSKQ